jgi:D-sedoheptulose 7-phosphate isomerase
MLDSAGGGRRGRKEVERVSTSTHPFRAGRGAVPGAIARANGKSAALPLPPLAEQDSVRAPMNGRAAAAKHLNGTARAFASAYLRRSADVLRAISAEELSQLIETLDAARAAGRQVFICGNGGSAATASHFAAGLSKEGSWDRPLKFRALALTDNVAWITALANDTDYARVFVEQLKNHAQPDDVLIAFSGSGNSSNVLRAVEWANEGGLTTVGITGRGGGQLGAIVGLRVSVDCDHMGHVEEGHFLIQHLITYYFMEADPVR